MVWQEDLRLVWPDIAWGVHMWEKGCVVEGHRGILLYTPSLVRVKCRMGTICIEGEELRILSLAQEEVYIQGVVLSIRRE